MSNSILVLGESGAGKSTSIRNLNPKETYIINVLDKPFPFRGYKKMYGKDYKNYHSTSDYREISKCIHWVNTQRPDIKTLILDDFQYVMATEFMDRAMEKGYDKWSELGKHVWDIFNLLISTRPDLYTFVLTHSDTDAAGKHKIKTLGKLLDEKVTLEGMFTVILHSKIIDGRYVFINQNDGIHLAKSPMGLFADKIIDNDLQYVLTNLYEFNDDINDQGEDE